MVTPSLLLFTDCPHIIIAAVSIHIYHTAVIYSQYPESQKFRLGNASTTLLTLLTLKKYCLIFQELFTYTHCYI